MGYTNGVGSVPHTSRHDRQRRNGVDVPNNEKDEFSLIDGSVRNVIGAAKSDRFVPETNIDAEILRWISQASCVDAFQIQPSRKFAKPSSLNGRIEETDEKVDNIGVVDNFVLNALPKAQC